ncbi:lipopolysaccharide biosynthesis protein [Stenotrophomonas humi]
MLKLASGNAAGKLSALIAIPIITRLYDPSQLGTLAAFAAVVALVATLSTLRYVWAIPLPRRDSTAVAITCVALGTLAAFTVAFCIAAYTVGPMALEAVSLSKLTPYLPLIVAGVVITACHEILTLWTTRKSNFRALAISQAQQGLAGSLVKIIAGLMQLKPLGLLLGHLAQLAGGNAPLIRTFIIGTRGKFRHIRRSRLKAVAVHYVEMPRYQLPAQLMTMASIHGPALLAPYVFGMADAGQLALALTALSLPVSLLANSMGHAYFSAISAIGRRNADHIMTLTKTVITDLLLLAALPSLILLTLSPWLFETAFGQEWRVSGEIAQILAPCLALNFISLPLTHALTIFRKQGLMFRMSAFRLLVVAGSFSAANIMGWPIKSAIALYSALLCLHYALYCRRVFQEIKLQMKSDASISPH